MKYAGAHLQPERYQLLKSLATSNHRTVADQIRKVIDDALDAAGLLKQSPKVETPTSLSQLMGNPRA